MYRLRLRGITLVFLMTAVGLTGNPFFGGDRPAPPRDEVAPRDEAAPRDQAAPREEAAPDTAEDTRVTRQSWLRTRYAQLRQRLLRYQRTLNNNLAELLSEASAGRSSIGWIVLLMSFVYGVAHAVLPGHRKTVIVSYYLSEDARILHGIGAGFAFALMHVVSAVLVVAVVMLTVQAATMRAIGDASTRLQTTSSWLIIGIGLFLLVRKVRAFRHSREERVAQSLEKRLGLDDRQSVLDHVSTAKPASLWPVIVSAGLVPCPITTSVLLFSVSFGVLSLGLVAVLALSLGLGVALSGIAVLTIFFRERILLFMQRVTGHSWQHVVGFIGAGSIVLFGVFTLFFVGGLP